MADFDLLDAVLPEEGRYCVVGISRYVDQRFADTREEVDAIAQEFVSNGVNAFFGCAKFGDLNNRKHENAKYFKALWMDIDCGPTKAEPDENGVVKGYIDQATGLAEFQKFCKTVGLRRPIVVNSGNGIHVYWLLDEVVDQRHWKPLAAALKDLCRQHGLVVDPAVFEASRVLRIPGTFNFKADPLPVSVLFHATEPYTYDEMKDLLGAGEPEDDEPFIPRRLSPLMESMMGNKVKRFKTIMMKSVKGEGCPQLLHCFQNQNSIEEPLWRAALSIADRCIDREDAIHKMSANYEGYDPEEADKKARETKGPYLCKSFESLNPALCEGCSNRGRISTPILLGAEIAEADPEDDEVEVEDEDGEIETFKVPAYPEPYFRGLTGGVYQRPPPDSEADATLVYERDIYVVKRMVDVNHGETALLRLHMPHDGVKEFPVPLAHLMAKDKLREILGYHGVVVSAKRQDLIFQYLATCVNNLQQIQRAEKMRTQFGWVEKDSKFIVGDREITKDGIFYSPPSSITKDEAEMCQPVGTLEKWKEVFNLYGKEGLEPNAFAAMTGFGSPLLKFTGMSGAIINVIHKSSGSGKSTTLYMCNSIWGHPKKLASIWKDTPASKYHRLGVLNNLPNTVDEITNTSATEFSDLAYSLSQGRGKNRMKAQSNEMRVNNTTWNAITLTSANASFYQKLGALKDTPDGESMRLLEYEIKPSSIIELGHGKQMFDHQLFENYGHAGDIYAKYLIDNLEDVCQLVREVQAKIDATVNFTTRERFWSAVCACNITGALIARKLGLIDWDIRRIYDWMIKMLGEMREEIKPPESSPITVLGEFLGNYMNNALVVNDEVDARSNMPAMPTMEPKGELVVRYEPDTKHLYVSAKHYREYCVKFQIGYKDSLRELEKIGVFKESINKRMAKGLKVVAPAVRALKFDTSSSDYLQIGAPEDEDRDGDVQD
jgi:hypothetical protein